MESDNRSGDVMDSGFPPDLDSDPSEAIFLALSRAAASGGIDKV